MEKKIRLGIIGIGNMGTGHTMSVMEGKCPDLTLAAVADINPARLAWVKETYGDGIALFEDADAMIESGLVDACIVSVPHYFHPRYVIACLEHGLHVMCEKPAGVYTKQVREMIAAADRHPDLKFGMMFNQRTNWIYRAMHDLVKSGKYGQIRRTNWLVTNWYRPQCYYDSGAWRATWSGEGGGVLLNQCPHQLDLYQWICGLPTRVDAHLHYGKWHDIEVEDDVTAYLEYENGATGCFITSTGDSHGSNRFEIQMDGAQLIAENNGLFVHELDTLEPEFTKVCKNAFDCPSGHDLEVETDGENPQHNGVLNAWANAILRDGNMVADGREGVRGLTLSNAMHLSSWIGDTVELPFDEDLFYEELMKRVATSRRKDDTVAKVADLSNTYGGAVDAKEGFKKHWDTKW